MAVKIMTANEYFRWRQYNSATLKLEKIGVVSSFANYTDENGIFHECSADVRKICKKRYPLTNVQRARFRQAGNDDYLGLRGNVFTFHRLTGYYPSDILTIENGKIVK